MADPVTNVITTALQAQFLEWLKQTPAALAKFVSILSEFYKIQGETTGHQSGQVPDGPIHVRPDQPPALTTCPLTTEELDAMMEDRATAQVKALAIEFIKGFIMGLFVGAAA